ncbi:dihydrofolate reductase family protein [Sorangium sp. So ce1151]|uniref:dihydrofolate reductase family protein n=1 Tax=Sorangium sp. So ce1151 TaxID=3133332 RepID=UPI003F648A42
MGTVKVFNFVTLDGYFAGPDGDVSWNSHGAEEGEFASSSLGAGSTLLFGRVTYEHMASFWPTPAALKSAPAVAEGMNRAEKVVFSRTLEKAEWSNTSLLKGNLEEEVRRMKEVPGKSMTVLGSGSIVTQLAQAGLVDEFAIMVNPVALGDGRSIFKGLKERLNLKLTATKTFRSGVVLLAYQTVEKG